MPITHLEAAKWIDVVQGLQSYFDAGGNNPMEFWESQQQYVKIVALDGYPIWEIIYDIADANFLTKDVAENEMADKMGDLFKDLKEMYLSSGSLKIPSAS